MARKAGSNDNTPISLSHTPRHLARMLALVMVLLGALAVTGSALADGGERIVVNVDEPFVVDGKTYPAGNLSVRVLKDFTPSSTLNEIWVGNERLGMMIARNMRSETPAAGDTAVFERGADGQLVLVGYTLRDEGRARIFQYKGDKAKARREHVAKLFGTDRAVLIASR